MSVSFQDCVELFKKKKAKSNKKEEAIKRKAKRYALLREAKEAKRKAKIKLGLELRKRKEQ